MRLKHLLVATDFGESSERAEDLAAELASKFDVALSHAHARLKTKHPNSEAVLAAGVAWDRVVETAKERDVDMIVVGTHARHGVPRFLLGSVAEKVLRLSPVPVLTVGSESRDVRR